MCRSAHFSPLRVKTYDQCNHREFEPTRILIEDKVYRPFLTSTMSYIDQFLTNNQNSRWFKFTMIALVVRFNDESNHREIQFSRNRNRAKVKTLPTFIFLQRFTARWRNFAIKRQWLTEGKQFSGWCRGNNREVWNEEIGKTWEPFTTRPNEVLSRLYCSCRFIDNKIPLKSCVYCE